MPLELRSFVAMYIWKKITCLFLFLLLLTIETLCNWCCIIHLRLSNQWLLLWMECLEWNIVSALQHWGNSLSILLHYFDFLLSNVLINVVVMIEYQLLILYWLLRITAIIRLLVAVTTNVCVIVRICWQLFLYSLWIVSIEMGCWRIVYFVLIDWCCLLKGIWCSGWMSHKCWLCCYCLRSKKKNLQ